MAVLKTARGLWVKRGDRVPPWCSPGRPVVFHHGIGVDKDYWDGWLAALAPVHPTYSFDMRGGHAGPDLPSQTDGLLDLLIEDLLDVVADLGPVHLVGESTGGTVSLAAAVRHPEAFASITVSNTAHVGSRIGLVGQWGDIFSQGGINAWSQAMMQARFAPDAINAQARHWLEGIQKTTPERTALVLGQMLRGIDLTQALTDLRVPLQILAPAQSPFIPLELPRDLHARVPGSQLHVFEDARHGLPFSHAPACAALALDFFRHCEDTARRS